MTDKIIFDGLIVDHLQVKELFTRVDANWKSQGFDDSYYIQQAPIYTDFTKENGLKRVRITVEEVV